MIHSHRLTSKNKRHKSFLEEERKDPITGDKLIEGNEIVLCGACKSAFLLDSWNYMAHSHCNQPFTLKEIPMKQHVVKEVKIEVEKKYKLILKDDNEFLRAFLVLPNLFFSIPIFLMSMIQTNFLSQFLSLFFIALILMSLFAYLLVQKNKIIFDKIKFIVSLPFNSKIVYLSEVEKLDFFASDKNKDILFLVIFFENGRTKRMKIMRNKKTISELKGLQEYFEENNLSNKISVFIDKLI
ncbi:hypothetical protein V9L05_23325 (plasmid) [Bernardetia sp. Wsw4-3y2]|uniref:hypothetical protein n=1 Tax=unclassified Bernardetia TaxID=2647129 RepID=UPI0030D4ED2C